MNHLRSFGLSGGDDMDVPLALPVRGSARLNRPSGRFFHKGRCSWSYQRAGYGHLQLLQVLLLQARRVSANRQEERERGDGTTEKEEKFSHQLDVGRYTEQPELMALLSHSLRINHLCQRLTFVRLFTLSASHTLRAAILQRVSESRTRAKAVAALTGTHDTSN